MDSFEILCIAGTCLALVVYYYLISNYDFWKSRGVRSPKPILGFGNFKDVMFNKIFIGDYLRNIYNEYKDESMIGIFDRKTPILLVKDPDLIKDILIKDFSTFVDRGLPADPLSQHLFALEPEKWRFLRIRLSPVFTSYKLKEMFRLMSKCADHFVQHIDKITNKNEAIECYELISKYSIDVIGNCIFGIEMNAFSDEDNEFRKMGRLILSKSWKDFLRIRIRQTMPWLYELFNYILSRSELNTFFTRIVMDTMNYREMNNVIRNDFIDLLNELKKHPDKLGDIKLTESFITSQAFAFFKGGYETALTTVSHALYELALNQKMQDKLREEIDEEYTKNDSDLIYENVKKMNYLDKVFKETLRKYPPATMIIRKSGSSYTFNGTTVTIPKGQRVWISIFAIQRDPDIYPKPDVFDPERFTDEVVQTRHAMHYLPFGHGPRNCIGFRFAVHQIKIVLIKILRNYKVETCDKTPTFYVSEPKATLLVSKDGIHLRLIKVNQTYN